MTPLFSTAFKFFSKSSSEVPLVKHAEIFFIDHQHNLASCLDLCRLPSVSWRYAAICDRALYFVEHRPGTLGITRCFHRLLSGRSLNARLLNEAGTRMDRKGDRPSRGAGINDLLATTSKSSVTSDSIAATNRSNRHDRSLILSGVGQLGSKATSPSNARAMIHTQEICSSTELSSDGRSDDKAHPPDCVRPVRLPVDGPELHFAHVPVFFEVAPDATTASPPDRVGPAVGSVAPSTSDEAGAAFYQTTDWLPGNPMNVSWATEGVDMELPYMDTVLWG